MEDYNEQNEYQNSGPMSGPVSGDLSLAAGAPNNGALYDSWFVFVDKDNDGRIGGADAVQFFGRSSLPREILSKIWAMTDTQKKGYLNKMEFIKAMEYISLGQQGLEVNVQTYLDSQQQGIPPPSMRDLELDMEKEELSRSTPQKKGYFRSATMPARPNEPQYAKDPKSLGKTKYVGMSLVTSVTDGLKQLYMTRIKPLEEAYKFGNFYSPYLEPSDFDAKPQVLLLGQYSTGKTTFIKYLLGKEYPGLHIGPEPTTDRFIVVMNGHEERRTPGNTLAVQPDKPYKGLSIFGSGFLGRFEGSEMPNRLLQDITLIDTPGVLSGEKQRIERSYDFINVCGWFAARADVILLMFDPYKLDISDEFKQVINTLKGHDDKVRIVLNKADQIEQQQLMRVYGALMWSLGKVFKSPEVVRVYIGSFNAGKPIRDDINPFGKELFESEQQDLMRDLYELPQRGCDRKMNEFVKRVRAAKIHTLLMGRLREELPMFNKVKAQEKILAEMDKHFLAVQQEYHLPPGDFPDINRFRDILKNFDLSTFPRLDKKQIAMLEATLAEDLPTLVKRFENPF
eukprot:TRINITY_DN39215_c0_g1_i2.p1 TRINITY_DN39215_c0_g1~~TRINITY_DN39215_c0_g1_i2.p1  ORF type:complete len:567 (-),score=77.55 TRINITY_DN39215_c0_g1_i2:391-2091(-)